MNVQIKIGTTEWRSCPTGVPDAGHVLFVGEWKYASDGFTPHMIWDLGLNNVREMTQAEIDAIPVQKQAVADAAEPDLATLRNQATQAIANIDTFLAVASPSNAQVLAEVKAIDQRQKAVIKALARLVVKTL